MSASSVRSKPQPRHCATAFGRGRHGGAGTVGWAGCRPHGGGRAGATGSARGAPRSLPVLAVFCSGQGTNLQAILNAIRTGRLCARVGVVISDRPHAPALRRARRAGVEARYLDPKAHLTRTAYERAILRVLAARHVELICLAGFMRILSPVLVGRYRHRILNIHPALLPAFAGAHAVRDALAWGTKMTGVTVHFVDEQVDHGPIIMQEAVPIHPDDTEATLLARVHRVEHRLYPRAIRMVLEGRARLKGRTVVTR